MAGEQIDIKVISRKNSGFPDWLDFENLRTEGIEYLGKLSGKIWTDHNVHDPGITILEVLCYALMDLGYRSNLPIEDILAREPGDKTVDNNFLTPSQVLTNNPLTITDFRKLLIDIKGIKNAWLEVATDQDPYDFCAPENPQPDPAGGGIILSRVNRTKDPCCISYLNGLYHVYLDTEINIDKEFESRPAEKQKYVDCLIEKVRNALMRHRNICEDFIDIKILCKWEVGVCAEIELEDNADPEKVYLEMVEKLRQFFSPSPQFYTLPQLLEANKTIDEIFAGRPFDVTESHGFVDTAEFEALKLRKSIHVSDVYGVLFTVKGIRKVQRLRLRNCTAGKSLKAEEWVVKIPEDHVPDFSVTCSGFEFNREGIPVTFDFRKYDALLEINFEHNGKILYTVPSDKLDSQIPNGFYHKELGAYTSIQNDFPRVYGIAEGGLSDKVSSLRKAQALQLKGYLLFFDQLLTNYLSQLKNIRSLFSLAAPATDDGSRHTYFSGIPGFVPDLQELVRYKVDDESAIATSGETGFLAFPVSRKYLLDLAEQDQLKNLDIEKLSYYKFPTVAEKETAISQLVEDMMNEAATVEYVTKSDDCVYYYILSSSDDYALIGRKYYKDVKAAKIAVASLIYAASVRSNYRSLNLSGENEYSFSVELNIRSYAGFLQALIEDETLYRQRRKSFLDHLLARFAEKFTDFALLSYGFYSDSELQAKDIEAKERYLSNLPLLSSTRGKAFDYLSDGWYTDNNSGFEKRIRALLGHDELKRKSLCNFAVYEYDEKFMFRLALTDELTVNSNEKFETREEAARAAAEFFDSLSKRTSFRSERLPHQNNYVLKVIYGFNREAVLSRSFSTLEVAESVANGFSRMMLKPESRGSLDVANYRHSVFLKNMEKESVRIFSETSLHAEEVKKAALKNIGRINDPKNWKPGEKTVEKIGKLLQNPNPGKLIFIDRDEYKTDVDDTIVGKPGKFNYELLDKEHRFKFLSLDEFDKDKEAAESCLHALSLLTELDNLIVEEDRESGKWNIYLIDQDRKIAVCSWVMNSKPEIEQIKEQIGVIVRPTLYEVSIEAVPHSWNFKYEFGYEPGKTYTAQSLLTYPGEEEARSAMIEFDKNLEHASIEKLNKDLIIHSGDPKKKTPIAKFIDLPDEAPELDETIAVETNKLLDLRKKINQLGSSRDNPEAFASFVDVHEDSKCRYVYHLVDKDALYAVHLKTTSVKADIEKIRKDSIAKNIDDYNFLELYLRGEKIVVERIGSDGKTKWYHYQLSSSNNIKSPIGGIDEKIILFESTKGYSSREEAEKAFLENYLYILTLAIQPENYGEGKPISEKPMLIQIEDVCISSESIVYIPAKTLTFLGTYPQQSVDNLINIVKSYPIRSIKKLQDKDEFEKRFSPCKKVDLCKSTVEEDCPKKKEKPVYFFVLYDKVTKQEDWQSVSWFDTAADAMNAFRFFLLLLKYEGNYFIDCDCTGFFKLYIREVLAESMDRFMTEELAWGKDGIQKFINVSQSEDAFHAYVNDRCCYSFFVACRNIRLVHPCKYDTPEIRDRVIRELQRYASQLLKWKFDNICDRTWKDILVDLEGNPLTHVNFSVVGGVWSPDSILDGYLEIISYIGNYPLCIDQDKNEVYLNIDDKRSIHFIQTPGSGINTLEELRKKLLWLACYFPFVKKEVKEPAIQRLTPKYCIEIRLPGFNSCVDCKGKNEEEEELCPVAWVSECCFPTCGALLIAFKQLIGWLQNFRLYLPVFECKCGPYGIELYDTASHCIQPPQSSNTSQLLLNGIVARNPQCFPSAEFVCEAISRAKKLINSEGLHLVEHILLRPRCEEDCECVLEPCPNPFDKCKFPYWNDNDEEDPCDQDEPVCFKPGYDPYSFIATIALPAWPERFRKKESRVLIENMLHREAPAHVALRILWLTPHDLCCFEKHFKRWLTWIAYKKICFDNYQTCDFVNFLFRREFECWKDRLPCETCEGQIPETSCVDELKRQESETDPPNCPPQTWFEQISELYCWSGLNCDEWYYRDCDEVINVDLRRNMLHDEIRSIPDTVEEPEIIERAAEVTEAPPPPELVEPQKKISKPKFVNSRLSTYRKNVDAIVSATKENDLALKVRRYLDSGSASADEYNRLLTELGKAWDKAEEKAKKAESKRVFELISNITRFYLDKLVFNGGIGEELNQARKQFLAMRRNGMKTENIYKAWDPDTVQEYEPETDLAKVEKILKG